MESAPKDLHLSVILDRLILEHEHGLASSTIDCFFKPGLADFERFLQRPGVLTDLNRDTVNRWIIHKTEQHCPPATIKTRRNAILGLWRFAYEVELLDEEPKRVRKVRLHYAGVDAWTSQEVAALIKTAYAGDDSYLGNTGLPRSLYFASLISTAYDTALRLGDLLALSPKVISMRHRKGYIRVIESKTGKLKQAVVQPYTLRLIEQMLSLRPDRELVWPLWCRREQFYRTFRSLVVSSGIRKGTFRWLRRASITHVEVEQPGLGQKHAGHSDSLTTQRHYTDRNQLAEEVTAPPPLFPNSRIA